MVWVASTCVSSLEPMPKASAPSPPWVQVWLSPHTIRQPGRLRPSSGPMTWTMPCPGWSMSNSRMPVADVSVRNAASSSHPVFLCRPARTPSKSHDPASRRSARIVDRHVAAFEIDQATGAAEVMQQMAIHVKQIGVIADMGDDAGPRFGQQGSARRALPYPPVFSSSMAA